MHVKGGPPEFFLENFEFFCLEINKIIVFFYVFFDADHDFGTDIYVKRKGKQ